MRPAWAQSERELWENNQITDTAWNKPRTM